MNTLLAKALHPASGDTTRIPKAGKSAQRRILAMLMALPMAAALSLIMTAGAANAAVGPVNTTVSCDKGQHTISTSANVSVPYGGGYASIQVWIWSYQTGKWYPSAVYTSPWESTHYSMNFGPNTEPPGQYFVEVRYGLYTSSGWQYTWDQVGYYTQYGTTYYGIGSNTCFA
jgi:hypothetical protein